MNLKPWGSAAIAAVLITSAATLYAANGDELKDASALYKQNQLGPALEKINAHLASKPKDAQGRFLKGLILTEQKKPSEAIAVFTSLTEDYPELPEPYNNLAVLYASKGEYDKAKTALELAIHTHPSYATAHENLGDIYAQLASRAYDKALSLDPGITTAKSKLAMIKDLFGGKAPTTVVASNTKTQPVMPVVAPPPPVATPLPIATPVPTQVAVAPPLPTSKPVVPVKVEPKPSAPPVPPVAVVTPVPTVAVVTPVPAAEKPVKSKPADDSSDDVVSTVLSWSRAWQDQNVASYVGHYAPNFEPGNGQSRNEWEANRRDRIEKPSFIKVNITDPKVTMIDSENANVSFRQTYESNTLKSQNTKTLRMTKSGGKWLIAKEVAGG